MGGGGGGDQREWNWEECECFIRNQLKTTKYTFVDFEREREKK
jgi:hypothetical protein